MFVRIETGGTISLHEKDDYKRLFVERPKGATLSLIDASLDWAGAGRLVPEPPGHAALSVKWLRDLQDDDRGRGAFDSMIEYAAKKGWVVEGGSMVLAHLDNAADDATIA